MSTDSSQDSRTSIGPVTLEVLDNRIDEAVREMQHVMFRTGYSTIIRDSKDGSAGICLPDGRVIGQAFRLPLHCGVFPPTIERVRETFSPDEINPGDAFIVNDPYRSGANHVPDLLVITPVFADGELQAFCTNIAHKPDVGGLVPGSSSPDAREIYHEGLLLPPVKFRQGGEPNSDIERIIRNNSRTPDVTMGDVRGQVGCTDVGAEKLRTIFADYGADTVHQAAETLIDATRRRIADEIRDWDGTATVTGQLDSVPGGEGGDLITVELAVRTTAGAETLTFDFTGSSEQSHGPANMQPHVVRSACYLALVGMIDPSLSLDAGVGETCEFVLPEGTVVHPRRPAPCNTYSKGMCVVVHSALRALSEFAPHLAVAETSNTGSFSIGNQPNAGDGDGNEDGDEDENIVLYDFAGGGFGGHAEGDGSSGMASTYKSNVQFPSLEILETEFPHRLTEFSILTDSAGAGTFRGGLGLSREFELGTPSRVTYRGANHEVVARGVAGGKSARRARALVTDGTETTEFAAIDSADADPGDRARVERPGGAGYGDPFERPPERVLADVRDGFVSVDAAAAEYGVVIRETDDGLAVDDGATCRRRE